MKTLQSLLEECLEHQRSLRYSPYTGRQYQYNVGAFLRWLHSRFRVRTPERLRRTHLLSWQRHLSKLTTRKGRPLKARSINKKIENMRGFLSYLVTSGYIQKQVLNALVYVKEPKTLPGSVLRHGQVRALLEHIDTTSAQGYRNRTMLELLYSSGLRVGELLGMNIDNVDFTNATALVTGKGSKERVVPIGRSALKYLETYVKAIRPYLAGPDAQSVMFHDDTGKRMPYHTFLRILHRCADAAGLDGTVTPHTFRRSCATEMLRGGAGMYHVKELLGHESLDTLKHYAKLTICDLKRTHERCHPREKDSHAGS